MRSWTERHGHHRSRHWVTGSILIGVGILFLLERQGYIDAGALRQYWPFIIAVVGIGHILDARDAVQVSKGAFLIFLGCWLYASIEHLWGLSFRNSWPMILIAVGLTHIVGGLAPRSDRRVEEAQS